MSDDDQTNNQQPETADAAPGWWDTATTEELRAGAQKAQTRRDNAIAARRTTEAELADERGRVASLESRLRAHEASQPKSTPQAPTAAPEKPGSPMDAILERLTAIEGNQATQAQAFAGAAKTDVVKDVLAQVPDGNRKHAELVIAGLEVQGIISLGAENAADAVLEAIHQHSPGLLRDPSRPNMKLPPSVNAGTGDVVWSNYNTISEVPKDLYRRCPDSEWKRLTGSQAGTKPMAL